MISFADTHTSWDTVEISWQDRWINSPWRLRERFFGGLLKERLCAMFPNNVFGWTLSKGNEDAWWVDYWITKTIGKETIVLGIDFTVSQKLPWEAKNLSETTIHIDTTNGSNTYKRVFIFLPFLRYDSMDQLEAKGKFPDKDIVGSYDPVRLIAKNTKKNHKRPIHHAREEWERHPKYPINIGELHWRLRDITPEMQKFISQIKIALTGIHNRERVLDNFTPSLL